MYKNNETTLRKEEQMQAQINSLKKRNYSLEQTFIEKMSQIAKLQAHLLSNSSVSNHYSLSAQAVKNSQRV